MAAVRFWSLGEFGYGGLRTYYSLHGGQHIQAFLSPEQFKENAEDCRRRYTAKFKETIAAMRTTGPKAFRKDRVERHKKEPLDPERRARNSKCAPGRRPRIEG
jgi:hypothetical protein